MTLPDTDTLSTYGGALANYGLGVVDPTTDRDAAQANKAYANVAMMTHTAVRGWFRFTTAATTGALVLVAHDALYGNGGGVAPTMVRNGLGDFTITLPTSVSDELVVAHALNIRGVLHPSVEGAVAYPCIAERATANTIRVRMFSTAFAAADNVGTTVLVPWL